MIICSGCFGILKVFSKLRNNFIECNLTQTINIVFYVDYYYKMVLKNYLKKLPHKSHFRQLCLEEYTWVTSQKA